MLQQMDLFNRASLNPVPRMKEAMREAIKESGLSRDQVVDRMNELARAEGIPTGGRTKKLSIDMLEKWLSESAEHLIPWKLLPIFCYVVNSISPFKPLLAPLGAKVIDQKEELLLEWAKGENQKKAINKKQKLLIEQITL